MRKYAAIAALEQQADAIRALGATSLYLFGIRPALRAILDAIEGIENAVCGKTREDFAAEWLLRHGTQRGIEIISEAARRIPPDLLATQPLVPWAQIMGIGNVLRHEYHRISDTVVWNVVQTHLPP